MNEKEIKTRILLGISLAIVFSILYYAGKSPDYSEGKDIESKVPKSNIETNKKYTKNEETPTISQKPNLICDEFKNGYKDILWSWNKSQIIDYFKSHDFFIEDESIYHINDGRSALSLHFRKGSYKDYRSNNQMRERFIKLVNDNLYQIQFSNHYNWNYNFKMALDVANKIADKYNLQKKSDQTVGLGARNIVWFDDCPDFRVIVRLFWDPNVIEGEANRFLEVSVFNVEKDNEFIEIQNINRIEKRKKRIGDYTKDL